MVKINPPDDIDELKKRGGTQRHIVKRVIDSTTRERLDSIGEENILKEWLNQTKPDDTDIFYSEKGKYPAISRLDEYAVVAKEVELENHRIDSVIRWPEGQPDGHWKLVEVKTESGIGPGVVGHLITKETIFTEIFNVRDNQVEKVLLTDSISAKWRKLFRRIERRYGVEIIIEEIKDG